LEICGNIIDADEFVFNLFPGKMIFNMYVLTSLVASRIIGYIYLTLVVFKKQMEYLLLIDQDASPVKNLSLKFTQLLLGLTF